MAKWEVVKDPHSGMAGPNGFDQYKINRDGITVGWVKDDPNQVRSESWFTAICDVCPQGERVPVVARSEKSRDAVVRAFKRHYAATHEQ